MDQVRRGVLFTAGIAGMMMVVLVFALVIYNNAINSRERTSEVGVIDRISDLELSIKNSLRDIFNLEANINVTIDEKNVIFNEELPNDEDDDFRDNMNDFKAYLELEFKENPKVKINATKITDKLPLVIKPNSITHFTNVFRIKKIIFYFNTKPFHNFEPIKIKTTCGYSLVETPLSSFPNKRVCANGLDKGEKIRSYFYFLLLV